MSADPSAIERAREALGNCAIAIEEAINVVGGTNESMPTWAEQLAEARSAAEGLRSLKRERAWWCDRDALAVLCRDRSRTTCPTCGCSPEKFGCGPRTLLGKGE